VFLEHENQTFGYAYWINFSYESIGQNNLSLQVLNPLNHSFSMNESILSRALSYNGNVTESGVSYNNQSTRKSEGFRTDTLTGVSLSFGLLGVLLMVLLVNRFIK
jgi:hypothetical protein